MTNFTAWILALEKAPRTQVIGGGLAVSFGLALISYSIFSSFGNVAIYLK